jgi:hypothetical protein
VSGLISNWVGAALLNCGNPLKATVAVTIGAILNALSQFIL